MKVCEFHHHDYCDMHVEYQPTYYLKYCDDRGPLGNLVSKTCRIGLGLWFEAVKYTVHQSLFDLLSEYNKEGIFIDLFMYLSIYLFNGLCLNL